MPISREKKCKKRLDKKNPRHKRRHTTLCKAMAKIGCLKKNGTFSRAKKRKNCVGALKAINMRLNERY